MDNIMEQFFQTVKTNDSDALSQFLEKGQDPNATDHWTISPLMYAVRAGNESITSILLNSGANPNGKDLVGWTPLMHASASGNVNVVWQLLDAKVEIDAQTVDGLTALMIASYTGHVDVVAALITAQANINIASPNHRTPLLSAIRGGRVSVVKQLIDAGATMTDSNAARYFGNLLRNRGYHIRLKNRGIQTMSEQKEELYIVDRPMNLSQTDLEPIQDYLRPGSNVSRMVFNNLVTFLVAPDEFTDYQANSMSGGRFVTFGDWRYRQGYTEMIQNIIHHGMDINAPDEFGQTAIMEAVRRNHIAIVELLVNNQANLATKYQHGWTPGGTLLVNAAAKGYDKICQILLDHGSDPNAVTEANTTALLEATMAGHQSVVEQLLKNTQTNINYQDNHGNGALMLAIQKGNVELAVVLIETGADINAQNADGRTPLFQAASDGQTAIVELLIKHGASINQPGSDGSTPIMSASYGGHRSSVKKLIEAGADLNLCTGTGQTALMLAAFSGKASTIQVLATAGVPLDLTDHTGWTALMMATFRGYNDCVKMLISSGADINFANDQGETALSLAHQFGRDKVVALLMESGAK